jgi:potassium efflux system protein
MIVLIGIVLTFNKIGLGWSKIQWLATALTFGLAFGLQEIFANFVSGLIILFERPVRVGDVVTVDDISGVVSRVRIRATTITNWDRKEFVVPNKEFITGRILNWTLSDSTNRVVINVGIAYGSDTDRAGDLLVQIAREHPLILDDPAPVATFEGFGDSTLNLVLRVFLATLDCRLAVIHDLHTSINRAFRDAGIEIAFPQRDLHVRSLPDGWKSGMPIAAGLANVSSNGNGHA